MSLLFHLHFLMLAGILVTTNAFSIIAPPSTKVDSSSSSSSTTLFSSIDPRNQQPVVPHVTVKEKLWGFSDGTFSHRTGGGQMTPAHPIAPEQFQPQPPQQQQPQEQPSVNEMWDNSQVEPILIQGGTLMTWSFRDETIDHVKVLMKTEGRPLNANVDLWKGPDYTPQKMSVYIEDGCLRPFCAIIATPHDGNAVAIKNTAEMEYPLEAMVDNVESSDIGTATEFMLQRKPLETIQGGALKTYSFSPMVESIQILLTTDGFPMYGRLELLQGPNNRKQVMEIYTSDGLKRPFYAILESPGSGNVVRVLNTGHLEYPMKALLEPFRVNENNMW